MKSLLYVCLILVAAAIPCCLSAQTPSIDLSKLSLEEIKKISDKHYKDGTYTQGLPYAQTFLQRTQAQYGKDTNYVQATLHLASYYKRLARYDEALVLNKEGEQWGAKLFGKQSERYMTCLNNLATAHGYLGDYDSEIQLKEEYSRLAESTFGKQSYFYARSLTQRASTCVSQGRSEEALALYQEAVDIIKNVDGAESEGIISPTMALGNCYVRAKKFSEAEMLIEEAGRLIEKKMGKLNEKYISYLLNISRVYIKTNRFEDAEQKLLQIVQIAEKSSGKRERYADANLQLANFYIDQKQLDKVDAYLDESLRIIVEIFGEDHPKYANALITQASKYYNKQQYEAALHFALQSLRVNCNLEIDSQYLERTIVNLKKITEFKNGGTALSAIDWAQKSLAALYLQTKESRLQRLLLYTAQTGVFLVQEIKKGQQADDKFSSLKQQSDLVSTAIHAALALEDEEIAFSLSEQNKAVLLSDALQARFAYTFGDLPDSLAAQERRLQQQIAQAQKDIWQSETEAQKKQYRSEWNSLHQQLKDFKKSVAQQYPRYQKLKDMDIVADVWQVKSFMDDKTVFLEYHVLDTMVMLFRITNTGLKTFLIPFAEDSLQAYTRRFRLALTDYEHINTDQEGSFVEYTQSAYFFYQTFLHPALESLTGKEQLIIVPDGVLWHLPFEAFLVEQPDPEVYDYKNLHYLLRDYRITYNYSATLWKENRQTLHQSNNGQLIAFGASYNNNGEQLALPQAVSRGTNGHAILSDLPSVKDELKELRSLFSGEFLENKDANEGNFKKMAPDYAIIHLAMHGLLNTKYPILSSLAFTNDGDTVNDDFLQAYEISNQHLNCDLVVLSACETGYGKFQAGEGVMSLARAFMYAGVPSLVVSLWEVNDVSTSMLMRYFYRHLYNGLNKSEALRQAKLEYLQHANGIAAHPAYWSPFVQIGDPAPIRLQNGWAWWMWALVGTAVCLVGGGIFWWYRRRPM